MKYKNKKIRTPLSPFGIHSIIGFNIKVPIMNLTIDEEHPKVAYACAHVVNILDCQSERIEYLLGHERDIVSIRTAETCKILVTSDKYLINIWEREDDHNQNLNTVLLKTLDNPMFDEPILATGLSVDGQYLVLACHSHIQLWNWRNGSEKPDAVTNLPDDFREGSKIIFCRSSTQSNSFIVTTESNLFFCRWNVQKTLLETHSPKQFPGTSQIFDSTYCTNYCRGISIANRSAIVWSDTSPSKEYKPDSFENRMEFQFKLKLGYYQLRTVSCCQRFVIISDSNGQVKIYDENLKFYFLYELFGQIVHTIATITNTVEKKNENCTDEELGQVWNEKYSSCIGQFFVSCDSGKIFKCNLNSKPTLLGESAPTFMICFDVHPNKEYFCGGREGGYIFLYDYAKNTFYKVLSLPSELPKKVIKSNSEQVVAICLKFSSCGRYIAAGMNNGHLLILNTLPFKPFQKALQLAENDVHIEKVIFSETNEFIVYHDSSYTVGLLHFESKWKLVRKCRVHDNHIVHMSFRETDDEIGLRTISEDYRVAEYTIRNFRSDNAVGLSMKHFKRTDFLSNLQTCIPMMQRNVIPFPNVDCGNDQIFLTSDDNFKFQIRNIDSFEVMHTFAAPITENDPIAMMCNIDLKNANAISFSNNNIIGLHHLPIDGNPNKYLAMVGHPRKILHIKVSHCNKYLFTIGDEDQSVYIWKINMPALINHYRSGGTSLKPFCNLIPDGVFGQLFRDMQDIFFYMQIRSHENDSSDLEEFKLKDGILVSDVVDYMTAIGFFPNPTKVEYLIEEIKYYTNDSSMITFENLVKLFVNYKPPFGYLKSELHKTLKYLGYSYTLQSADTEITRDRLVEICTSLGEEMDENEAGIYLNRLDGQVEANKESSSDPLNLINIRSVYTISEFLTYMLGVE